MVDREFAAHVMFTLPTTIGRAHGTAREPGKGPSISKLMFRDRVINLNDQDMPDVGNDELADLNREHVRAFLQSLAASGERITGTQVLEWCCSAMNLGKVSVDSLLATKLQKLHLQDKAKAAAAAQLNKPAPPAADLSKGFDKIEKALDALTKKTLSKKTLDTIAMSPASANHSSCRAQKRKLESLEKDGWEEERWEVEGAQKAPKEKGRKEAEIG